MLSLCNRYFSKNPPHLINLRERSSARNFITIRPHRHVLCFSKYDVVNRCALSRILAFGNRPRVRHENSPRAAMHSYNVAKVSKIYNRIQCDCDVKYERLYYFYKIKLLDRTSRTWNFTILSECEIIFRGGLFRLDNSICIRSFFFLFFFQFL